VQRELGKGGMGSVYLAHDEMLGRDVAVKTIVTPPAGTSAAETLRSRFMNEARAIASLSHPNVVNVFDAGVDDGTPYLVMEVVAGPSLKEQLADGAVLDPTEGCALGIQIAQALNEAHAAGIVHRDVKPANILRHKPGQWKLGDFGVARIPDSSLTLTGQFLGTPAYAAPETLSEGLFAPSCDIYALAATLYEAVAGAPPFPRSPQLRMAAIASGEGPRPLAQMAPHVPGDLVEVIERGLEANPAVRPSAAAFAEALAVVSIGAGGVARTRRARSEPGASAGHPTSATAAASPATLASVRPRRRALGPVLAFLVLAAGGGAFALYGWDGSRGALPPAAAPTAGAALDAGVLVPVATDDAAKTQAAIEVFDAAPPADAAPLPLAQDIDAAPAEGTTPIPAKVDLPELERGRAMVRAGRRDDQTLSYLQNLRRQHPEVAEIPYLIGRVYFARMWWTHGFDHFRAAIDLDPSYRHDEVLIANSIEALMGNQRGRARTFLVSVIGEPAIPQLRAATQRRDSMRISRGAAEILRALGAE
jgi:eukaryotic-like serine/threonine-protein kinase